MEIIRTSVEKSRRRARRRLLRKTTNFVVICAFLTALNYMTSPGAWWVQWVVIGWGLHIALSLLWYLFDCDEEADKA